MARTVMLVLVVSVCGMTTAATVSAQALAENDFKVLEERVEKLESKLEETSAAGAVLLLFAAFCALWAQNTGRSPWLWFFLGLFFHVITVLVLLVKNSRDLRRARAASGPS